MITLGHLGSFELALRNGGEWQIAPDQWLVLQLLAGTCYVRSTRSSAELGVDDLVIVPPGSPVTLLASQLGQVHLRGIGVRLDALSGLVSALERRRFETAAATACHPFATLTGEHSFARRFKGAWRPPEAMTMLTRIEFLHGFSEFMGPHVLLAGGGGSPADESGAKSRLERYMAATPQSELISLSLSALAIRLACGERHLSRVFLESFGCTFQKYLAELRLERSCQLLADGNLKIIDVALESGHGSLATFNLVFKRRFRVTPSEWRNLKKRNGGASSARRRISPLRPRFGVLRRIAAVAAFLLAGAGQRIALADDVGGFRLTNPCSLQVNIGQAPPSGNRAFSPNFGAGQNDSPYSQCLLLPAAYRAGISDEVASLPLRDTATRRSP